MDIIILADFCRDFKQTDNNRFLYLAKLLGEKHSVEIVTSDFNHGEKTHFKETPKNPLYKITMLKERGYKKNISLTRFYSHYNWGKEVAKYLKSRNKPDVIYCAVPTLMASYKAAKYCQKNRIKFIVDIQDLWPEAFQMAFNIPVVSKIAFSPFRWLANAIYCRADEICAVSNTYVKRALQANKKRKKGYPVFLGTELSSFDRNSKEDIELKKGEGESWLAYCGTLGNSYDLTCVFDAIDLVSQKGITAPRFIVMGDGPRREEFEEYADKKNINVCFTGKLAYDKMCALLCKCDITVNPIVRGSAANIINKHADYAASGLPVLNTQESQEYRELVEKYNMGFNCKNNNAEDLAEKMLLLIKDQEKRKHMGENARKCAEEVFDRKYTYKQIVDLIEK